MAPEADACQHCDAPLYESEVVDVQSQDYRDLVAVFTGFAAGSLVMFEQMGFGMSIAIFLDATPIPAGRL